MPEKPFRHTNNNVPDDGHIGQLSGERGGQHGDGRRRDGRSENTRRPENAGHAEEVLRDIFAQAKEQERSIFSQKTYAGEPLLKTGKDFKASPAQQPQKRATAKPKTAAPIPQLNPEYQQRTRAHASLPPLLQELRALEEAQRFPYARPLNTQLFIRQAQMAADFVDNAPYPRKVGFHRQATYADLADDELRGYFTWRGQWFEGAARTIPPTYTRIRAAEIVNDVRVNSPAEALAELERLLAESRQTDTSAIGINMQASLSRWINDYILLYGLDTSRLVSPDEREFAHAVMTLRAAEEAIRARMASKSRDTELLPESDNAKHSMGKTKRAGGKAQRDAEKTEQATERNVALPSITEIWNALRLISSPDPAKSPFLRTHEKEAAAVTLLVFEELVRYNAKHASHTLVDSLVGRKKSHNFAPFLGLPWDTHSAQSDTVIELCEGYVVTCERRQWSWQRAWDEPKRNKELGGIIRGIDRQMRIDWEEGKTLKERSLPAFLVETIAWASSYVRDQERAAARAAEEERTRLSIDLSKLDAIRSDAAHTRESLLVDEEIDEPRSTANNMPAPRTENTPVLSPAHTVPAPVSAPVPTPKLDSVTVPSPADRASAPTAAPAVQTFEIPATLTHDAFPLASAAANQPDVLLPTEADLPSSSSSNSSHLSPLEHQALALIAQGQTLDEILAGTTLMETVLIDAINEKLFDIIGDAVIEYVDGRPQLIEDYREDVAAILDEGV